MKFMVCMVTIVTEAGSRLFSGTYPAPPVPATMRGLEDATRWAQLRWPQAVSITVEPGDAK